MKKIFLAMAFICGLSAQAQIANDKNVFNHLSVGVGVGTTGVGIEVGTTVCPVITLRAGVDFMPGLSYNTSLEFDPPSGWYDIPEAIRRRYLPTDDMETDIKVQPNMVNGKILADIYLGRNSMFHFTVGAYFGRKSFIQVKAKGEVVYGIGEFNRDIDKGNIPGIGTEKILLEGYELGIDQGRAKASINTKSFKPYVGIGIGRTTPRKRVGVKFEMGAQFWGKPTLHDDMKGKDIDKDYPGISSDMYDVIDIAGKVCVYPTIKLTLFGRIF